MNVRPAALSALLAALAAAPGYSRAATPVPMGPPAPGECVIGSKDCGALAVAEGALMALGRSPAEGAAGAEGEKTSESKAPPSAPEVPDEPEADLAAIGGQIIRPPLAAVADRAPIESKPEAAAPASRGAAAEAAGLSFLQTIRAQKKMADLEKRTLGQ